MIKLLSIFKFLLSFIVALGILLYVIINIFFPGRMTRLGYSVEWVSLGKLVIIAGVYVFYLVRTARWNWKNTAYRFNILLIAGTMAQCYWGSIILLRQNFQIRDAFFWMEVSFVFIIWSISVYDAIYVFKALNRRPRQDSVLAGENDATGNGQRNSAG